MLARPCTGGVGLVAVAAAALAGCFSDPTEVVVVVDTDAKVGRDFSEVGFCFSSGQEAVADGSQWPVTVGVRQQDSFNPTFSVLVTLTAGGVSCSTLSFMGAGTTQLPFATRKASDVRFVDGEMRVLFLPILKICACVDATGQPITGCPHALDPDCEDLTDPPLGDFDPDNIPHLPTSAKAP
jgi:hypothetical protein